MFSFITFLHLLLPLYFYTVGHDWPADSTGPRPHWAENYIRCYPGYHAIRWRNSCLFGPEKRRETCRLLKIGAKKEAWVLPFFLSWILRMIVYVEYYIYLCWRQFLSHNNIVKEALRDKCRCFLILHSISTNFVYQIYNKFSLGGMTCIAVQFAKRHWTKEVDFLLKFFKHEISCSLNFIQHDFCFSELRIFILMTQTLSRKIFRQM